MLGPELVWCYLLLFPFPPSTCTLLICWTVAYHFKKCWDFLNLTLQPHIKNISSKSPFYRWEEFLCIYKVVVYFASFNSNNKNILPKPTLILWKSYLTNLNSSFNSSLLWWLNEWAHANWARCPLPPHPASLAHAWCSASWSRSGIPPSPPTEPQSLIFTSVSPLPCL